jgi:hypothetical protein
MMQVPASTGQKVALANFLFPHAIQSSASFAPLKCECTPQQSSNLSNSRDGLRIARRVQGLLRRQGCPARVFARHRNLRRLVALFIFVLAHRSLSIRRCSSHFGLEVKPQRLIVCANSKSFGNYNCDRRTPP